MGLSGSGKTTTARYVVEKLREANENVVHLDGDDLRDALNQRANYDQTERVVSKAYHKIKYNQDNFNTELVPSTNPDGLYYEQKCQQTFKV